VLEVELKKKGVLVTKNPDPNLRDTNPTNFAAIARNLVMRFLIV
jgi:hypothetical protein